MIGIDPHIQLRVRDQDEALVFYTEKVGMEVRTDAQNAGFRWLTVGVSAQPDVHVLLSAAPEGQAGGDMLFLTSEDCAADYRELAGRGVEFVQPPEENPWATVAVFRDPSGNTVRLTQAG
jgi:predicted enzyme related to lactoylglutathione lyase